MKFYSNEASKQQNDNIQLGLENSLMARFVLTLESEL